MDKPTTPGGTGAGWSEDSGSEGGFGATGVFGTVRLPEPEPDPIPEPVPKAAPKPVSSAAEALAQFRAAEAEKAKNKPSVSTKSQAALKALNFQEPVVHKVVFGGAEASSAELLDQIRIASAERAAKAEKASAAEPRGQGSAGFTDLLRSLGSDTPVPKPRPGQTPEMRASAPASATPASSAPVSGFTSLLQTLNVPDPAPPPKLPVQIPVKPVQEDLRPASAEPPKVAPTPAPGGFTELLRIEGLGGAGLDVAPGSLEAEFSKPLDLASGPVTPAAPGSKPGAFTQLFGTLGNAEDSAPSPVERGAPEYAGGGPGSFTRMLSLEQMSADPEPAYREEQQPLPGKVDYGLTPSQAGPGAPGGDPFSQPVSPFSQPFSQPLTEAEPVVPIVPPPSGVGITRLIQMLDEPVKIPAPAPVAPPVSVPATGGPGIWTQTFASLEESSKPAAPATSAGGWSSPPAGAPAPAAPMGEFSLNQQPPAPGASGPSEFTRILDASKLREMVMKGGQAGAASGSPAPTSASAPMPSFAIPPPPAMPAIKGMPQPGGFAPPPPPAFPASFAPPPMPAAPAVPKPPEVKPPQVGAGKLQGYVPLMLAMIIVLLVVILVTVIFLMKH